MTPSAPSGPAPLSPELLVQILADADRMAPAGPDPLATALLRRLGPATGAEAGAWLALDETHGEFEVRIVHQAVGRLAPGFRFPSEGSAAGKAAATGETVTIADATEERRWADVPLYGAHRSLLLAPAGPAGDARGILLLASPEVSRFGPREAQAAWLAAGRLLLARLLALGKEQRGALAEMEARARVQVTVLDRVEPAVLTSDGAGTVSWANRAAAALLGLRREDLAGRNLVGFGLDAPSPGARRDVTLRRADGREIPVRWSVQGSSADERRGIPWVHTLADRSDADSLESLVKSAGALAEAALGILHGGGIPREFPESFAAVAEALAGLVPADEAFLHRPSDSGESLVLLARWREGRATLDRTSWVPVEGTSAGEVFLAREGRALEGEELRGDAFGLLLAGAGYEAALLLPVPSGDGRASGVLTLARRAAVPYSPTESALAHAFLRLLSDALRRLG